MWGGCAESGDWGDEVFVPQVHAPGVEAEVDWYEAAVDFPGGRQTLPIFVDSGRVRADGRFTLPRPTSDPAGVVSRPMSPPLSTSGASLHGCAMTT